MKRSKTPFLKSLLVCLVIIFAISVTGLCYAAPQIDKAQKAVSAAKDATYTIAFQNRIKGKMRPEEKVDVKWRSNGSLYIKWSGKRYKGRELLFKPGWNNGKGWIHEGGVLDFAAISVGPEDALIKNDYLRSFNAFGLGYMVGVLNDWKDAEAKSENGKLTLTKGDQSLELTLDGSGAPKSILIKKGGKVIEDYKLANIKLNAGLTDADFSADNPEYGFPGYEAKSIYIDPAKMQKRLNSSWGGIKHYTCDLTKQERIGGKMQEKQTMALKFRKPCDIYAKWSKGSHNGRQILYRHGTDDKLLAKEAGILGITSVRLDLDSPMVKRDTTHRLTDMDIGYALDTIYNSLGRGLDNNEMDIQFKGVYFIGGRRAYRVDSKVTGNVDNYYSAQSQLYFDVSTGLPVKLVNIDAQGNVFEEFVYTNFKFNSGLTDKDFDPKNPEYGF